MSVHLSVRQNLLQQCILDKQPNPGQASAYIRQAVYQCRVWYRTVQYTTVQYSTVQYSTVQYSTAVSHILYLIYLILDLR